MRILALTNLYPPYYVGGYELGCQQVMERLAQRGHRVAIVTSTHGVDAPQQEGDVHRILHRDDSWAPDQGVMRMALQEVDSRRHLKRILEAFRPDVALAWSLEGLANGLLPVLRYAKIPVACGVSDYWIMDRPKFNHWVRFWHYPALRTVSRLCKPLLRRLISPLLPTEPPGIPWHHTFFTSHALRQHYVDAGVPAGQGRVIYWGVDGDTLVRSCTDRECNTAGPRLLYAGRLVEPKGVHTFLEAIHQLAQAGQVPARVSLVGEGPPGLYLERLHALAESLRPRCDVQLPGRVPFHRMAEVYRSHDVLVFPSIWPEPFSLTLLEAMAAGLCVVASTAGGSAEILQNESNSLTYQPGDVADLARQLHRVYEDRELRHRLALAGQRFAQEQFPWSATVEKIEELLYEVQSPPAATPQVPAS